MQRLLIGVGVCYLMMTTMSFRVFSQTTTIEFFFNLNDTILTVYSQNKLNKFIKDAHEKGYRLEHISVFSDTLGSQEYNFHLSEKRLEAIRRQLGQLSETASIRVQGKTYLSIKYPIGELQFWRRVEINYSEKNATDSTESRRIKGEILLPKDSVALAKSKSTETKEELFEEVYYEEYIEEYKEDIYISTFDTITDKSVYINFELNVQFFVNTDRYKGDAQTEITSLVNYLKKYPHLNVIIRGHVCCGPNMKISKIRAKRVYNSLMFSGIDKKRIIWVGMSNTDPVVDDASEERQKNRRVDVMFYPATTKIKMKDIKP
jgi:outer membrane protein OmpA-like peptidoglycan-associated protein